MRKEYQGWHSHMFIINPRKVEMLIGNESLVRMVKYLPLCCGLTHPLPAR
jgi:hypothetical protein